MAGGRRCWSIVCQVERGTMRILEDKHGPSGAICGCNRPGFSHPRASLYVYDHSERATEPVGHGLDSLAATEFTSTLSANLGIKVSPTMLFDHPTLSFMETFLLRQVKSGHLGTTIVMIQSS